MMYKSKNRYTADTSKPPDNSLSANYNVATINTSNTLRNNQQLSAGTIYKHVTNNKTHDTVNRD